ncbi:SH3 and PX domain-containing protein 2A [Chanos chanos]|uniref:SH3 and PX domain-containing protein 2A n=1 Tax=Chanos chanos TaxID=29144 RepID=A0A6J2WHN5_CHACN|nr:SH3 and PX domain-containing protein 2A-like [Chanos chanos]
MARRAPGARGRGAAAGSWLTACFFPSSSGRENREVMLPEDCMNVFVVTANYNRQEKTEISLKAGQRVEVIEKNESGWWFVSTAEEQGWVPATYLISPCGTRESLKASGCGEEGWYEAVQSYSGTGQDEISFESGVMVEVIQKNLEGWWFVRYQGKEGWAPASYLRKVEKDVCGSEQAVAVETGTQPMLGQVEIIGNLMEISNLLNKKPGNDRHTHSDTLPRATETTTQEDTETEFNSDGEFNTDECINNTDPDRDSYTNASTNHTTDTNGSRGSNAGSDAASDSGRSAWSVTGSIASRGKTLPASPAVARVAPQRYHSVESGIPTLRQKPPPRRENSLGFQLPQPPEPPSVEAEYYTIAEFHSCLSDGISFSGGQKADVIEKNSGGWWYVQIGEKEGWAPCSYIDKRKKPTLNRRTSTLTRPKVPPPAPPVKKQDSKERVRPSSLGTEVAGTYSRPVYEEPEYDVPSVGLDLDCELEFLPGDSSSKASPSSSLYSASFTTGEEEERWGDEEEECIYMNDGFRPVTENPESSGDSDTPKTANSTRPGANRSQSESEAPISEPNPQGKPKQYRPKHAEGACSKPKPSVRPKPALTRSCSTEPDFTSLRRQLKPTAQQHRSGPRVSREEDSETASIISSEDSLGSRSTSTDLSSTSKSSRGETTEAQSNLYRTTAAYQRGESSEISFPANVEVEVLEKQESGWWFIRWGLEEGWAPTYYLQPIKQPEPEHPRQRDPEANGQPCDVAGSDWNNHTTQGHVSKSSSLEKNEQRVQTLNNINQNPEGAKSPAAHNKPPDQLQSKNAVKQLAVKPQAVLTSSHSYTDTANSTDSLRRNDLQTARDGLSGSLRHASNHTQTSSTNTSNTEGLRRTVPVSMVKPKPHLIHNNLRDEYVSIADYCGDEETMGFPAGTRLEVLERNPNGWWYCRVLDGGKTRKGWVPSNFLERRS